MLTEICAELRNWFCGDEDKYLGTFNISGGKLTPSDFLLDGQYFRIIGSVFNDGVYRNNGDLTLQDEAFNGAVWAMRPPVAFLDLVGDITEWEKKNSEQATSVYTSESFGGYSYTKADGMSWKMAFAPRLRKWRKL